ncbi:patatin-like protein 2 [Nicotiana tabacum]|uniref:Patatin n=1 Tax=Nicotiana tabacum TaxID=4097 RepID=A0A1S3X074_TOBAC|nr:patatin-like protein 2 [Nicotiana tomentosiformis]XP_016433365.1 PREDICTED: patatin-like protein 2 [Nicotiana tabacum]
MLTAPNKEGRPLFAAKDIIPFYLEQGPKIFPYGRGLLGSIKKMLKSLVRPKYNGKYLHKVIQEKLGQTRLCKTLTNIIVPTFDIKNLQPIVFSTFEAKEDPLMDARLSDICISTSAAPTYLPAHYFKNQDKDGHVQEFNLVDGGVAANNPVLVATSQVTKQIFLGDPDFSMDCGRFLVISLGTGSPKVKPKYNATTAIKWGLCRWLLNGGSSPIVDVLTQASDDMVNLPLSALLQALHSENNYLRIQDDTLSRTNSSVDISTKDNMDKLVEIGKNLLKKPVSRINSHTGLLEPCQNGGSNEESLKRFAKLLSEERRLRKSKAALRL